jgi:hypothetical protein
LAKKTIEQLSVEAAEVGLELIGPYLGVMSKTPYRCAQHGLIYQTANKVQQGIGCQLCGRQRQFASKRTPVDAVRADAERVGLELLEGYVNQHSPAKYRCAVHGEIRMRPISVRRGATCQRCALIKAGAKRRKPPVTKTKQRDPRVSIERLAAEARASGLRYADIYVASHSLAKYECPAHGIIEMRPAVVRRGRGCRFCSGNQAKGREALEAEASRVGLTYIGPETADGKPTSYRCAVHGIIRKRPGCVRSGGGCRACAKYGFDASAPATFYVYRVDRFDAPPFIGYGITKDHETRHKAHLATFRNAGATGDLLATFDLPDGRSAANLEMHIQASLRDAHIRTDLRGFISEALTAAAEPELMSTINGWLSAT